MPHPRSSGRVRQVGPPSPFREISVADVGPDIDPGALHAPPRLGVPVEGERDPRAERQHVRSHRRELVVGHLDQADVALAEHLHQAHRDHREIHDGQIHIQRRDERHQVEALVRPVQMRQVEHDHVDGRTQQRARSCATPSSFVR